MKTFLKWLALLPIILAMAITQPSCKKQHLDVLTDTTVNIVDYLKKNPARFSEFIKILDRTNISPFLNAYGAYTCFAPTNDAIALYLKKIGKTSTDQLDTAALKSICRFHIIQDTITTRSFNDGKLPTITMYGQYLITSISTKADGTAGVLVNRQAYITLPNVLTGNGYVHEIDHVLEPATQTIAQMIVANPKYSIFAQALQATGVYDSLNQINSTDTTRRFLTFFAESDSVLKAAGYASYAALKARFSNTGNPANHNDSLYLYMAYHIVTGNNAPRYVADIVTTQSIPSLPALTVITIAMNGSQVLLNQATFNGVTEAGALLDRANSDNTAANGVIHNLTGDIYMKLRQPFFVYLDFGDQPEIRKLTATWRKPGAALKTFNVGDLADVTSDGAVGTALLSYANDGATSNYYSFNDYINYTARATKGQPTYIEFKTPLLVQGQYKVWVCYRSTGGASNSLGQYIQASVDGVALPRVLNFSLYLASSTASDAVLESQNFKRYSTVLGFPAYGGTSANNAAQLAGVVNITTTDRHLFRLTTIKDSGSSTLNTTIDMVEFIPVSMDQQYPRFLRDGTILLKQP